MLIDAVFNFQKKEEILMPSATSKKKRRKFKQHQGKVELQFVYMGPTSPVYTQ